MAAGASLEENKNAASTVKKAEAFTDQPASSNKKLMDFEAQLLLKAGKPMPAAPQQQPPVAPISEVTEQA